MNPLFEFRLPPEYYPIVPSRPTACLDGSRTTNSSHELLRPFSTDQDRRSTCRGSCRTHYGPPSGFGYPLDGLRPSVPSRLLFQANSALGIPPLRSMTSRQVSRRFHLGGTRIPFNSTLFPKPKLQAGPTSPGSRALSLTGAPIICNGFSAAGAGNSLGVRPLPGCFTKALIRISPDLLSHALTR
jgi:hypothetical protein